MKAVVNASIKIPTALHARVVSLAEVRDRSPHALMLQAIDSFVSREEKRESLRQEARVAHEHYMQTGLHLTNAEVLDWLAELSKGNDVEPPRCHV